MPKLTIDGKEIEVEAGTNLIEAARRLGIEVPHYCYHPGSCHRGAVSAVHGRSREGAAADDCVQYAWRRMGWSCSPIRSG